MTRPSSTGGFIEARLGREGESLEALDGKTYDDRPRRSASSPTARGAIGLGGVMGGESTGCSEATTDVFVESAWFDPIRTAQTGRTPRHHLRRPVPLRPRRRPGLRGPRPGAGHPADPGALRRRAVGGRASPARRPRRRPPIAFDPAYVQKLSGLDVGRARIDEILTRPRLRGRRASQVHARRPGAATSRARPTWSRRWRASRASTPCPPTPLPRSPRPAGGVLTAAPGPHARRAPGAGRRAAMPRRSPGASCAASRRELFGGGDDAAGAGQPDRRRTSTACGPRSCPT